MISTKEMRLGNIFQSSISNFKLHVTAILPERILYDGEPCSGSRPDYEIEGIPLTEEILLKCGFVHDQYLGARDGSQIKVFKNGNLVLGIDDNGQFKQWHEVDDYWYNYFSEHPIIFLHELQNIYYWLSGKKELEVNL